MSSEEMAEAVKEAMTEFKIGKVLRDRIAAQREVTGEALSLVIGLYIGSGWHCGHCRS
jgi:hypothetical protein